ncbi:redoxin domain-containing protein [Sphingobacterium sp. SRCM116780]|uniref:TlpA family protein disulfide reductase n=1 Tax=Sphingobacterium sp. SRCM116780 TaxID=2907623 RepID=UPI001F165F3B|nr:redoxin domain-containing protein [Sphingobacterium sp. SRCM116780]UIR57389.1 redoxin domain-containing protein [Sphingobacterium sp. SRCM116780]
MRLTTLLCFFLFFITSTEAQDKYGRPPLVPGIAELHIGDQVPDILIDKIINNDKRSIRTSDYKDKLLVLDFWDTTCATCIESMPKVDSLQRVFGDRIKLLSVTYQPEEMISKFFKTNRFLNERNPPVHRASVVDDRALRSYFHYETNPHVVWIYKGKVVAITGGEYITSENIQTLLDGKSVAWPLKNDSFDPMNPIMLLNGLSTEVMDSPFYGYSVLTGMSNSMNIGLGGIFFKQDTVLNISRLTFFNQDINGAYQVLLSGTKSRSPGIISYLASHPGRKVLEIKDPSRYLYRSESGSLTEWNRKNLICYELVKYGVVDKMKMAKMAIQDLNNKLGLNVRYEMRKVKCLVFVRTDKPITDTVESDGMLVPEIVLMRLDMAQKYPPAIDETGFTGRLRMEPDDGTIAGLRKEMQRHGLDLIEAEREIEVMVISDAK